MLSLNELSVERYRNVAATRLEFGPRFNVLLGKNATGKTTLLKLIAGIVSDDLSALADEDERWALSYELGIDESRVSSRVEATPSDEMKSVGHRRGSTHQDWDAAASVTVVRDSNTSSWNARNFELLEPHGFSIRSSPIDARFRQEISARYPPIDGQTEGALFRAASLLRDTALELSSARARFDEALLSFDDMSATAFRLMREAKASWIRSLDLPRHLRVAVSNEFKDVRTPPEHLLIPSSGFSRMAVCQRLLEASALKFASNMVESSPGPNERTDYEGLRISIERANGHTTTHERFSFGQKRLIAFFWHLERCGDGPVIADELVNGLHHEWIEACVDELSNQQSFLATQHPLLLDYIPIESAEEARRTFIRCTSEVRDGVEKMVWRNLTHDEAEHFFGAKQAGIRHVSEILRSQGLW